jgi:hypothetical protein
MDLGHGDRWRLDACPVCPAQRLPLGTFDVCDRPGPATRYDPTAGHRINTLTGLPECVHPSRVHLPAGRYASNGEPVSVPTRCQEPGDRQSQPPDDRADLEAWFTATLREAPAGSMAAALADAETAAKHQFPAADVATAMRRALSAGLTRGTPAGQQQFHRTGPP